jgi:hypothetical protein
LRLAVPRVLSLFLALALALGACQRSRPGPVVAMEPRPNPPVGMAAKPAPDNPRERLRQNRWLAQFWEELTPAQRRRVEGRMRRAQPPIASTRESAGLAWDTLGLAERDRLVFGGPAAPARPAVTTVGAEAGGDGAPPRLEEPR